MSSLTTLREDWEEHIHPWPEKFPTISQNRRHYNFIVVPLHLKPISHLHQTIWIGLFLAFLVLRNWHVCATVSLVGVPTFSNTWQIMYGKANLSGNSSKFLFYYDNGILIYTINQEQFKQVPIGTKLSPTLLSPSLEYISGTRLKIQTATSFGFYKVKIWVSSVASKAFNSIQDRYPPATIHGGIVSMTALVPEPILQAMAPGIVKDYHASHPQIIDPTRPTYDPVCDSLFFWIQG